MEDNDEPLTGNRLKAATSRRLAGMRLQEIEDNPLSEDQVSMFEMFEREGWSHERRRAYLRDLQKSDASGNPE